MLYIVHPKIVDYYIDGRGRQPFVEWFNSVRDTSIRARIRLNVERLKIGSFGNCKSLGRGLFELKMDFGPGYRAYFGMVRNHIVLLLCGGDKGTQSRDIQKAYQYWADYWRQHANETRD